MINIIFLSSISVTCLHTLVISAPEYPWSVFAISDKLTNESILTSRKLIFSSASRPSPKRKGYLKIFPEYQQNILTYGWAEECRFFSPIVFVELRRYPMENS